MARELFEDATRDFVAAFRRLVRIGGGAERDRFLELNPAQFVAKQGGCVLLDVNFLLKLDSNRGISMNS